MRRRGTPDALALLGGSVVGLALAAAAVGLFWSPPGDVPEAAVSAWGERVALHGEGLYRRDTPFTASGAEGTDAVTLALVVPLLVAALVLRQRGSARAGLVASGALAWTLYVYASLALGSVVAGELFLVHVAAASASGVALGLAVRDARGVFERPGLAGRLPRRGPGAFLVASGLATAAIWLGPLLAAAVEGQVPDRTAHHTGLVTVALDLGVVVPAAIAAGVLVWRGRPFGYALAAPLLVLEALLLPMLLAQTARQVGAGVVLTPTEVAGPVGGFVVLSLGAAWALAAVLRRVPACLDVSL